MKQEKNIGTKANSQNGQSIQDALTEMQKKASPLSPHFDRLSKRPRKGEACNERRQMVINEQTKNLLPITTPKRKRHSEAGFHPPSFGGAGGRPREGPPGRARSPGTTHFLFPEHPPDRSRKSDHPPDGGTGLKSTNKFLNYNTMNTNILNNKKQIFNNHFFNYLNFNIMKKQILFLAFVVMAIFASVTQSYGQALLPRYTSTTPITALTCAADANFLHPMAGVPYTYQMDGTTGTETAATWTWWATKNPTFLNAYTIPGDSLNQAVGELMARTDANYGKATAGKNSVVIEWSSTLLNLTKYQAVSGVDDPKSSTFVVGYATGTACADNLKVYEINPIINFTLDITNLNPTSGNNAPLGWDVATSQCVDGVKSATYTAATHDLLFDYGADTLYFEVAAANFNTDFTPVFRLVSGLAGVQTAVVTLHSSLGNARAGSSVLATTNWTAASVGTDWATATQFTATNAADVVTGVSLYVRVVITNSTYESLIANPFVLAVDARDNTNTGIWDMEDADCAALADAADQIDQASHTINPRPTITGANVPDGNAAAPNDIVTKNP